MKKIKRVQNILKYVSLILLLATTGLYTANGQAYNVSSVVQAGDIRFQVRPAHAWLPPFGLDRVGKGTEAVITVSSKIPAGRSIQLVTFLNNQEVEKKEIPIPDTIPFTFRQIIGENADLAVLYLHGSDGDPVVIAKQAVVQQPFEFEAVVQPDSVINPVDLGTILVPADWLLLAGGQKAKLSVAGISRRKDVRDARVKAWYASSPQKKVTRPLSLKQGGTTRQQLLLDGCSGTLEKDILHVVVEGRDGRELWRKKVNVMITPKPEAVPQFAAVSTKLRYDAGVLNIVDGKREHYDYYKAWKPELNDVVVFLPNGSRWVFWRGASYIPIWASRYNTGLSYEWAERISPNEGFRDCPEPLMDKELRYGRVRIVESTPARIHVRWDYQSCDFNYKANGDYAHEDYYFYPDGMGTRALTLTSIPEAEYEVAEFILLASQAAIPMQVLPKTPVDVISLKTGKKVSLSLPEEDISWRQQPDPLIYRIRLHQNESMSAFSFNPNLFIKPTAFKPFVDSGLVVTPAYWGGHWPLSRGFNTAYKIDESLWAGPSHNSLMTWQTNRPKAIKCKQLQTKNALGEMKTMREDTWVWLIGMTDATDDELLYMAKNFSQPATLEIEGAKEDEESYSSERRAFCLIVERNDVKVKINPVEWCVNPVFELKNAPKNLNHIKLGGEVLAANQYAWDGNTLWIKARFNQPQIVDLEFSE